MASPSTKALLAPADFRKAMGIAPSIVRIPLVQSAKSFGLWGLGFVIFAMLCFGVDVTPAAFFKGLQNLARFLSGMFPPSAAGQEVRILQALAATFAMAVAGTFLAVLGALPLGLLGAKTVVHQPIVHFLVRRTFDVFRAIPALVWALILIVAFGLGPFGGVLALAFSDVPRLAKLYAEAIENCDRRPQEGIHASGGSRVMGLRFGLVPEVVPVMASQSLYVLESNFRNAAILGIVGAGGIGFELEERIRIFAFDQVAWIVVAYVICVMILDMVSEKVRSRLVHG
jgi:phosphonate transport system permease protein